MYARLISPAITPGADVKWHCIIGDTPEGYNCVPIGLGPKSKPD